jgi:sec-independent protein translocase protein TatB
VFNLQGSEIIIVLLLALVVLGPEKLPDAMRKMGQAYGELKKMSSGFQSEFRAAVDEPLREIRDTANVLRDSADFTKLQDGDRPEKPKSGNMANLAPVDPDAVPTDDTPTFETRTDDATHGPGLAADSKSSPFGDEPSDDAPDSERDRPPTRPTPAPAPPPPFTGMSAPPPADDEPEPDTSNDVASGDEPKSATVDSAAIDAAEPFDGEPRAEADTVLPADEADTTR